MDYREQLITNTLLMLNDADIQELDTIKSILVFALEDYEVTPRCTDIVPLGNVNVRIIEMFLGTKKIEGGSNETAKTRWYVLRKFIEDINKPLTEVTTYDVLSWLEHEQRRVSLSTANNYRSTLLSLFSWMCSNKMIQSNPVESIKPIKHPKPIKNAFNAVEVDALKTACNKSIERAMIELLLSSGIRCEELCNLKWSDIDFRTNDINVIEGKGNKNRVTMMNDVTRKYLLDYRKSLTFDSEYVFAVKYRGEIRRRTTDSVWRRIKTIGIKAGVNDVYPHRFRRTCASNLYNRGLDVRMIQKLLGHANINTTTIYIDNNLDRLRDAYKGCI